MSTNLIESPASAEAMSRNQCLGSDYDEGQAYVVTLLAESKKKSVRKLAERLCSHVWKMSKHGENSLKITVHSKGMWIVMFDDTRTKILGTIRVENKGQFSEEEDPLYELNQELRRKVIEGRDMEAVREMRRRLQSGQGGRA